MSSRPSLDEPAIAAACRSYGVRRLELFGSAVCDPEHANDFDFLVDLEETEPGVYAKTFFGLYDALAKIGVADAALGDQINRPAARARILHWYRSSARAARRCRPIRRVSRVRCR